MNRSMLCGLALLSLAACGGGDDDRDPSALAQAENRSRTALAVDGRAALVTAEMTLDWAEYSIGDLFPAAASLHFPSVDYLGLTFNARDYSGPWGTRYLGITTDGRVFGLGDFTQGRLEQFETIDYWATQVLQDWCRVRPADCNAGTTGYSNGTPVPPAGTEHYLSTTSTDGAANSVVLVDGSRVDLAAQPAGFEMALERESRIDADALAALARRPGLQATGSVRGLYLLGSKSVDGLKPTFSLPATEALGLNPDTLIVLRLGTAVVDGVMDFEHEALLPVTRDAQGRLSFVDPLFRDGLVPMAEIARAPLRARARALQARARSGGIVEEWVGGARYVLATFQKDINWAQEPVLVRMVADPAQAKTGGRRPATAAELAAMARQPICNLVLLVHGHNEPEKRGNYVQGDAASPWMFSYKKLVWDQLYEQALSTDLITDQPLYPHACTAFYEFIYPSYRAIFSPVSAKGGGVQETLGEALGRLVGEEIKRNSQLSRMLDNGMPLNTVIVGHSQGGLVARAGLRFMPTKFKASVKRLVTWGTPHHGAALISMRYAMQAGHDLVIDGHRMPLQNLLQAGVTWIQLDTPGTRDLRLSLRQKDKMNLRAMFPSLDAGAETALAPTLYSANLDEFNTNIGTREIDPGPHYSFLTGTKQSSASVELEDASGWWLKFRGQQVSKFKASTGTEQGTTLNRLLLKSPYQASDGAAPLFSQQAAGLYGPEAIDMGDTDHEQFYGAEPAQRNADSLRKGRLTAERTLHEGRLDRTENTCPSIQGLALSAGSGTVTVAGRAFFPALASAPAKTGALIARVEARAGTSSGSVIGALVFQHDASGQFSATASAAAVPTGTVAVVVVLKDGSELLASVEKASPSDFDAVRVFEQPWTVTENREGRMRAEMSRSYNGAALQCSLTVDWTLPSSHNQPLQMRIVRLLKRDGVTQNDTFFLKYLSYMSRVMPVGNGQFATRIGDVIDPSSTRTNTAQGNQLDLSYLAPERAESSYYERQPTLYIEVDGLCGGLTKTQIRFDYKPPG